MSGNCCTLHPLFVERWGYAATVKFQRALLADSVWALEDPVLPRRQAAEDLGLHCLRPGEPQIRFHAGYRVGRKARALLEHHAHFVIPIEIFVGGGDETQLRGFLALDAKTDFALQSLDRLRFAQKTRLQARETITHPIKPEIRRPQRDRRSLAVVALAGADQHQRAVGSEGKLGERAGK